MWYMVFFCTKYHIPSKHFSTPHTLPLPTTNGGSFQSLRIKSVVIKDFLILLDLKKSLVKQYTFRPTPYTFGQKLTRISVDRTGITIKI